MIKAAVFDMDGTLIDSVDLHAQAWQDAFREFGVETAYADVRNQIGKGGDKLMPLFLSKQQLEKQGKKIEEYRGRLFKEKYMPQVKPFPGVRELFERLRANGTGIALASSAKDDELQTYKRIARIEDLLDAETSSEDAEQSKPDPDIFHAALERLGNVPVENVLVVGDSPWDAQGAMKAGLRTIGVLSGGFPRQQLEQAGCIAIFDDPAHLLREYKSVLAM